MSSIDLDHFPESAAAKRMLTYVTKGWYDKSYVGKWVFEVMGREIDTAEEFFAELPDQFFIDTATWGLKYHEIKYGLPVREGLSYEERRRIIRERLDTKAPMTPYHMEQLLARDLNVTAHVYDINDDGHTFSHPNIFEVDLEGCTSDYPNVIKRINELKQSHTTFRVLILCNMGTQELRAGCWVKEYRHRSSTSYTIEDADTFASWYVDESSNMLTDELGNFLIVE